MESSPVDVIGNIHWISMEPFYCIPWLHLMTFPFRDHTIRAVGWCRLTLDPMFFDFTMRGESINDFKLVILYMLSKFLVKLWHQIKGLL